MRRFVNLVLALLALSGLGCGGEGGGLDATPVTSSSFWPSTATTPDGRPAPLLWWRYQVNGGEPVNGDFEGLFISAVFDDVLMTTETIPQRRSTEMSGPISGSFGGIEVSGVYAVTTEQSFTIDDRTYVLDERSRVEFRLAAAGESAAVVADVTGSFDPPTPWFPDSDELSALPEGFVETIDSSAQVTGTVTVSATGIPTQTETIDERVTGSETWRIAQQLPSMNVLGVEYRDVVRVERSTTAPDPTTGEPTPTTIIYWLARGVGMIRAENSIQFVDTPLFIELLATNLAPSSE